MGVFSWCITVASQYKKTSLLECAPSVDTNQPAHTRSLDNSSLSEWRNFASLVIQNEWAQWKIWLNCAMAGLFESSVGAHVQKCIWGCGSNRNITQRAHNVETMSFQRWFNVLMLNQLLNVLCLLGIFWSESLRIKDLSPEKCTLFFCDCPAHSVHPFYLLTVHRITGYCKIYRQTANCIENIQKKPQLQNTAYQWHQEEEQTNQGIEVQATNQSKSRAQLFKASLA